MSNDIVTRRLHALHKAAFGIGGESFGPYIVRSVAGSVRYDDLLSEEVVVIKSPSYMVRGVNPFALDPKHDLDAFTDALNKWKMPMLYPPHLYLLIAYFLLFLACVIRVDASGIGSGYSLVLVLLSLVSCAVSCLLTAEIATNWFHNRALRILRRNV